MSRISTVVLMAMMVLAGAMGLKTFVTTHGDSSVMMANGSAPVPPTPWRNGSAPVPPTPWKNGSAPVPPTPWKNGSAPVPPTPWK
ncbi:MAG: hypothetical protein M3P45_00890 [Acidobacteriota bacterium]|nr:hypothetical protein [Acidobacteriota bacterium]